MAKKRKYSLRERAILLLGGAIKRNRKKAPENKARAAAPENKSLLGG
jgi:hypothetical protein